MNRRQRVQVTADPHYLYAYTPEDILCRSCAGFAKVTRCRTASGATCWVSCWCRATRSTERICENAPSVLASLTCSPARSRWSTGLESAYAPNRMTTTRCVHGMDSRFCAICNRTSRSGLRAPADAGDTSLIEILRFLNEARTRATYGAVAAVVGVPSRSIGGVLGARRPEASWVVNSETGLPTDYEQVDLHPDLFATSSVIRTGHELTLRIALWRAQAK